jgi:fatty acid desaturase
VTDYATMNEMRRRMREDLPAYAFAKLPWCAGILVVVNIVVAAAFFADMRYQLPWYASVGLALVLGYLYFVIAIVAHDTIHGSIVAGRSQRYALAYFGYYPFFISPHLWDVWHSAHHSRTNTQHDPDANPCWHEAQHNAFTALLSRLMPARSNRIVGTLFYFYWFTADAQALLWNNRGFKELNFDAYGFDKRRAIIDTVAYLIFWIAVLTLVGPQRFVVLAIVPMMVGNALFLAFATSEHIYMPRTPTNDALENTVSVKIPKIFDFLTLNFSHHVEHHLFPNMSFVHLPLSRAWLRKHMRHRYLELPMLEALRIVYQTERLYKDDFVLADRDDQPRFAVDTRAIQARFRPPVSAAGRSANAERRVS